jgi:hypothetical protein
MLLFCATIYHTRNNSLTIFSFRQKYPDEVNCYKSQYQVHAKAMHVFNRMPDRFVRREKILESQEYAGYSHNDQQYIKYGINYFNRQFMPCRLSLFFYQAIMPVGAFELPDKLLIG